MKKLLTAFFLITLTTLFSRLAFYSKSAKVLVPVIETPTKEETLTIATYNIHHGVDSQNNLNLENMKMLIKDADIVFLSEVDRNYSSRSRYLDQLVFLKRNTGLNYHAYAPTLEKAGLFTLGGSYGIAILSRYPIVDTQVIYLPTSPFIEPRVALIVDINWNGQTIKVLGTHLATLEGDRTRQLEKLQSLQLDLDFFLGDFNTTPKNVTSLVEHFNLKVANNQPTFPSARPSVQIDYILYGNRFDLLTVHTINSLYSDHLPVKAKMRLNYLK